MYTLCLHCHLSHLVHINISGIHFNFKFSIFYNIQIVLSEAAWSSAELQEQPHNRQLLHIQLQAVDLT